MPTKQKPRPKQYTLDAAKVKRVQRILKAKTEQEAIDEVLQLIIDDDRIDRTHRRLVECGEEIVDTLGRMRPS